MSELTLPVSGATAAPSASRISIAAIAWRNLWRNKRRTWLMVGGIAFAGFLMVVVNSVQVGVFEMMTDNTARFYAGHLQVQHPNYLDDPRMEATVTEAAARVAALESGAQFDNVAPRAQAFALLAASHGAGDEDVDADPPAVGGLVVGIDASREFAAIRHLTDTGRYLSEPGDAYVGAVLAQNLGVGVGDEIAVLGNGADGSVAAMVVTVAGTFSTGQAEFDRSQVQVHLNEFQAAFTLDDQVHSIALTLTDQSVARAAARALTDTETVGVPWQSLLTEVYQMAELKYQSSYMFYALLLVLMTFSIVNAFIMTTFERTPEFGMLKAVGMSPGAIMTMLCLEALWMALIGLALTFAVTGPLIGVLSVVGVPLGGAFDGLTGSLMMPDRLHPAFGYGAALQFSIAVLLATQVAALIPTLRLRRLKVVDALRAEE